MVAMAVKERKKEPKVRLSRGALEAFLKTKEAITSLGAAKCQEQRRKLNREWRGIFRISCSAVWTDDYWHRGVHYPPGGRETKMVKCSCCERFVPSIDVGSVGACYDCWLGKQSIAFLIALPGSTGLVSMARMRAARDRGQDYGGGI